MLRLSFLLMILSLVLLLIVACRSNKYSADQLPDQQLHFGTSGGFAGITTTTILLNNGQLFHQKMAKANWEQLAAQKKRVGKKHFAKARQIKWDELPDTEPGNLNYFIVWKNGSEEHRFDWSKSNQADQMGEWFEELSRLSKKK